MLKQLLNDEAGVVISAELVLIMTILVLGVIVGLSEVAVAVNTELNDISNAIGALDQSYFFTGFKKTSDGLNNKVTSGYAGSRFTDAHDDCDKNITCDLVCGPPPVDTCG
jgi:Flp pilus assembly pilin Flp